MTAYSFIFSNTSYKRIYRHVLFWLILALHFIIQNLIAGGANEPIKSRSFTESALYALYFFPIYVLSAYILMNRILPAYFFRNRYIVLLLSIAGLVIVDFAFCSLSGALSIHLEANVPFKQITFNTDKYNALVNGFFFPSTILAISGGIKIAKNWYFEQKENERLAKEKITRELQLLKTQLHPRFVFYSLHAIKKNIALHPSLASELILKLSDLLSYILYESNNERVSLEKEIKIIKCYMELQKKSRGGKLDTEISVVGALSGKYIFPLLLFSFIEHAFDFIMEESQAIPFLKLLITVGDNRLDYHLTCNHFLNRSHDPFEVKQQFLNLEKQLHFIDPGIHQLTIASNGEDMTIIVSLPIHKINSKQEPIIKGEIHELL